MYKVYITIENNETGDEETMPLGIAERQFLEDALVIREVINRTYGEINNPISTNSKELAIDFIMSTKYGDDDPKNYDTNLRYLQSMSYQQLIEFATK